MQKLEYQRTRKGRWEKPAAQSAALSLGGIVSAAAALVLMATPPFDPFVVLLAAPLWLLGVGLGIAAALIHTRRSAKPNAPALMLNIALWVLLAVTASLLALAGQIG